MTMKLNKNSVSNNTSEQPDKGVLESGSDLYSLEAGRYYIQDLSTMINRPPANEFTGNAILLIDDFDENGGNERGLQLWNDIGKYATARTQAGIQVTGWNVFTTDGGGTPGETIEGAHFIASSFDTIAIGADANNPSFITSMSLAKGGDDFAIDPATGAVQNRTGRRISALTGNINFQPDRSGGGTSVLFLYSERSLDGITWEITEGTLRTIEISNTGETFKTSASGVLDWENNEWVRFRAFNNGAGDLDFVSPTTTVETTKPVIGLSVFWELHESIGGQAGGEPQIGEMIQFAGQEADIPYGGEFHNHETTKVFDIATYPDFVALNRDSVASANQLNLLNIDSGNTFKYFPSNLKYWEDQQYYTNYSNPGSSSKVYIHNSETSNSELGLYIGFFSSGSSTVFFKTPGITVDDGNGLESITSSNVETASKFEVKGIKLFDGTSCNGFLSFNYKKISSDDWCINVKRTDLYNPDLSDWVNETDGELQSNEVNSLSDTNIGKRKIEQVSFVEDGIYILSTTSEPIKYSYDFTGGTLKEVTPVGSYNTSINVAQDRIATLQIGNITQNYYQIELSTGGLYINNSFIKNLTFNSNLSDIKTGEGQVAFSVNEYNDRIFISINCLSSTTNKSIQAFAYYDGSTWFDISVPEPSGFILDTSRSMIVEKFDFETGLIVASLRSENGDGTIDSIDTSIKFVISTDFGLTWFDDTGIANTPADSVSQNEMNISLLSSNNNCFAHSSVFLGVSNYIEPNVLSKSYIYNNTSNIFYTASSSNTYKLEWIYDAPLDTSTIIGFIPMSNKIKNYVRVK